MIVGPGPSLEKQRGLVRELSRRHIVIALGPALRVLNSWV